MSEYVTKDDVPIGVYTDDRKGILTGPRIYKDGKVVGFIDSEYVNLEFSKRMLEGMGFSNEQSTPT